MVSWRCFYGVSSGLLKNRSPLSSAITKVTAHSKSHVAGPDARCPIDLLNGRSWIAVGHGLPCSIMGFLGSNVERLGLFSCKALRLSGFGLGRRSSWASGSGTDAPKPRIKLPQLHDSIDWPAIPVSSLKVLNPKP